MNQAMLIELFRLATSRRPSQGELEVLVGLLDSQRKLFQAEPQRAKAYREVGDSPVDKKLDTVEVAAVTAVVNAMLNHDEAVMRR